MLQTMLAKLPSDPVTATRKKLSTVRRTFDKGQAPSTISGNIEGFENGGLSGWAQDTAAPERRVALVVHDGETPVGTGVADDFRADLKEAGIGDGQHAFTITLDDSLFDGRQRLLDVFDAKTQARLGRYEFKQRAFADIRLNDPSSGTLSGQVKVADRRHLVREDQLNPHVGDGREGIARIVIDGKPSAMIVQVTVDGEPLAQSECTLATGADHATFSIALPATLHDDTAHVFSARLLGQGSRSAKIAAHIRSVTTDWEHIAAGAGSGTLSALSGVAARRYRSLQAQFERAANGELDPAALAAVRVAHESVVRGPLNRNRFPDLHLSTSDDPLVSIVIPVHEQFAYTHHCLASIVINQSAIPYEVIVVDDCSSDETLELGTRAPNVRVLTNEVNLRFLGTAERGANAARGEYVLFLNNDTEVTHGWLESLLDTFERFADVGSAGAKLIYPSGKLQEAGGIVWGSGKPWNIGNGGNAEHPSFNYVREADYLSGAAMMVRASVWKEVGGFSKEFAPAYYEDTDLAFKIRDAGYRTLYCPSSVVVHYEGMSNGKELNAGVKRFQSVNAPKFRAKWRRAYRHNGAEGKDLELQKDRGIEFRVLMLDHQFPRPDNDAGSYAAVQEMRLLRDLGCKITFIAYNMAHLGRYVHELQDSGVECIYSPFYNSVSHFLEERGQEFDAVYVTRYNVAADVIDDIRRCTRAKIIFNNADLHFLREMRAAFASKDIELAGALLTRERELAVTRQVDAILSYNEVEHSVIASHNFREDNIFHCPWVLSGQRSQIGFAGREGIAFLGGFGHHPNVEAVLHFAEYVMPSLLARIPDIRFHVYGSGMPPEITALASDNIVIEGYVESLDSVFDTCRVFIAPLLSGAGIKGKVLESMSHGVPAVLSPIAAEATGLAHGASTLIAETDDDWVRHIEALYRDEALWSRIADGCGALVHSRYSHAHGLAAMGDVMRFLELDPAVDQRPFFNSNRGVER